MTVKTLAQLVLAAMFFRDVCQNISTTRASGYVFLCLSSEHVQAKMCFYVSAQHVQAAMCLRDVIQNISTTRPSGNVFSWCLSKH